MNRQTSSVSRHEKKAWIDKYNKLDKQINSNKIKVNSTLKICKASTLKLNIIKLQKSVEDQDLVIDIDFSKKMKSISSLKKHVTRFQSSLMNFTQNAEYLTQIEEEAGYIEEKFSDFKHNQISEYNEIVSEIDILDNQLLKIQSNIENDILVQKEQKKKNRASSVAKKGQAILELEEQTVDYIESLYNSRTKGGMQYRRSIAALKKVKYGIGILNQQVEDNGGANCGWPSKDHTKFTEVLFKCKGRIDSIPFMEQCSIHLAIYSEEAVRQHISIYKTYKQIEQSKRDKMDEYKQLKNEIQFEESKYRADQIRKEEKKKQSKMPPRATEEERTKRKDQIKKWKSQKEVERVLKDEREAELARNKTQKNYLKRKRELDRKKQQIEEYKSMKQMENVRKEQAKEMESREKKYVSNQQWENIQKREELQFQRQMQLKMDNQYKKSHRSRSMAKMMSNQNKKYDKVKSRLKQETVGMIGKQRDKFDPKRDKGKYADSMGGNLVRTTGKAMAGWRGGQA